MNNPLAKIVALSGKQKYKRLLLPESDSFLLKSGYVILGPGKSVGEHSTEEKEEAVIVFKGTAQVFLLGKPWQRVKANSLVYIPPHTIHDIKNSGKGMLKYVFLTTKVFT